MNNITQQIIANLLELKQLLVLLTNSQYTQPINSLSGGTIGQHFRHLLEFYKIISETKADEEFSYDNRNREQKIETDSSYTITVIEKLIADFGAFSSFGNTTMKANFTQNEAESSSFQSTIERELAYCLEHSIHHQALIKVALIDQEIEHLVNDSFGVAYSTLRNNVTSCAQ